MIRVFYGNDRAKIAEEVRKNLGKNYEVFDGENLKNEDIVNIFKGSSLFAEKRKILLKDLTTTQRGAGQDGASDEKKVASGGADFYEEMAKYTDTAHEIVIWETVVSQKKSFKDFLKLPGVEARKFEQKEPMDMRKVFDIYDTALRDGKKAVESLAQIKEKQDPYMFFGLMASQAIKKFEWRQGIKERKALKELAKLDMQLKSTTVEPWILIESFLIRLATL